MYRWVSGTNDWGIGKRNEVKCNECVSFHRKIPITDFFIELQEQDTDTYIMYPLRKASKIERARDETSKMTSISMHSVNSLKTIFTLHLPNESNTHTVYRPRQCIKEKETTTKKTVKFCILCNTILYSHFNFSSLFIYEQFKNQCAEKQDNPNPTKKKPNKIYTIFETFGSPNCIAMPIDLIFRVKS